MVALIWVANFHSHLIDTGWKDYIRLRINYASNSKAYFSYTQSWRAYFRLKRRRPFLLINAVTFKWPNLHVIISYYLIELELCVSRDCAWYIDTSLIGTGISDRSFFSSTLLVTMKLDKHGYRRVKNCLKQLKVNTYCMYLRLCR